MTEYDFSAAANTVVELELSPAYDWPGGFLWGVSRFNSAAQPRTAQTAPASGVSSVEFQALFGSVGAQAVHANSSGQTRSRVTTPLLYTDPWPATLSGWATGTGQGGPVMAWSPS
jgi:hypothetical protein